MANNETNYSLHNPSTYHKELDSDLSYIADSIAYLFLDYFKHITENTKLKPSNFSKFIITRGLDTIVNVFNHLLLYTNNVDATHYHCQKAFYLYVEFVGQISEDEKMFLQLSSQDAMTYVYKKTIYDINNDLKKSNQNVSEFTKIKINITNSYIELYKTLLLHLINNGFKNSDNLNLLDKIYKTLKNINKDSINLLADITDKLYYFTTETNKLYNIIYLIAKKIPKNKKISLENKIDKFSSDEFSNKLNDDPEKFIAWFMA